MRRDGHSRTLPIDISFENWFSDLRTFGLENLRNWEPSDLRTFGIENLRNWDMHPRWQCCWPLYSQTTNYLYWHYVPVPFTASVDSTELDIYRFWRIHSLWQVSLVKQGTLTRPEHLVPPPRHNALMFGWSTCSQLWNIYVYIDVCMCIHACICTYICVFTCIWMYVCECVFIRVYYNILYLLIVCVLWILTFEQRMVIWSYWYIFIYISQSKCGISIILDRLSFFNIFYVYLGLHRYFHRKSYMAKT